MNEWKRVYLNPRRLSLLLLSAALGLMLFWASLLGGDVTLASAHSAAAANGYAGELLERCRGRSFDGIAQLMEEEEDRLLDAQMWLYGSTGFELPFDTEAEAEASIADLPELLDAMRRRDYNAFSDTLDAYYDAAEEIGEEAEYLAGYGEYLAGIQAQAELQSKTSLFGKPGSFARRNLSKTAEDFRGLLGLETRFGNNRGLSRWLSFELGDYLHLIAIAVIVMSFLEERRRGLWPAVRATRGGRGRLGLTRMGILIAGSVLATFLYTLLPFLMSMALHGGWGDLGRPLQSVESFATCPLKISIARWLVIFFAVKILSGVLIGLFLWCVLGSIANPQFSVAALGVTLAAEFALYEYLPVQSFLNILKYFNIFSYVHTFTLYTEYLNVDILGFPVGIRALAFFGIAVFGLGFAGWATAVQIKRRPEGNRDHLSRLSGPVNRALDGLRRLLNVGGWEAYKSLVFQYGILLMALCFVIGGRLTYLEADSNPIDRYYDAYLDEMEGPIDGGTGEYIANAREKAESSDQAPALLNALDRVEKRVETLSRRAAEGGYEPWIADEFEYDIAYGPQSVNKQRLNAAIAILMTALLAVTLWPFERQSGVTPMLRATRLGRRRLYSGKAVMAAALAVFVWGCVYVREALSFLRDYPMPSTLASPVGNFDSLAGFPLKVTIGQYLAILYAFRLVMLVCVAEASMALGILCHNGRAALMTGAAVLGLPALLTALGAEIFKWVSPVVPVASAELMWAIGGGAVAPALAWVALLASSAAAVWAARRRWVR